MTIAVVISSAVEGLVDEAVVRRLIRHVGAEPGPIYGKNGKVYLRKQVKGYNEAARWTPWIVLVDLNHDADCAPPFRAEWLPSPAPKMCFRVTVREVEAWLLADRQHIARFLSVPVTRIPQNPEGVDDPKGVMVDLARRSRRRDIREDMVPRPGSGRKVGPAYAARLIEFVEDTATGWHPNVAATTSNSLKRCIECLRQLIGRL
ncbi:MAG: hypothetical protein HY314_00855 [Acidobacteria bacterium]|nr:hypothetical protein [Acidobacteriota bacterium]